MIKLNLLPKEFRKERKKLELPEIPLVPAAATLVGGIIAIQILIAGLIFVNKKQLVGLNKTWKELAPKKAELDAIKNKIASINEKTEAIDALIETQLNWSRILNELSNSLTSNIWLTELAYGEKAIKSPAEIFPAKLTAKNPMQIARQREHKTSVLTLSGFASGKGEEPTANVARFIRSLKDNKDFFKDFADVELVSMKKNRVDEQDVMNFTLVCRFRPQEQEKEI